MPGAVPALLLARDPEDAFQEADAQPGDPPTCDAAGCSTGSCAQKKVLQTQPFDRGRPCFKLLRRYQNETVAARAAFCWVDSRNSGHCSHRPQQVRFLSSVDPIRPGCYVTKSALFHAAGPLTSHANQASGNGVDRSIG